MRFGYSLRAAAIGAAALCITVGAANAESIKDKTARKEADIPTCGKNLGTIRINEPKTNWYSELGLESPSALLKVFVRKSGCFKLLASGEALDAIRQERELANSGELRQGSNMGKGQLMAADYLLTPDIASKNGNASGTNIGGILGGLVGGGAGAILANISINSKTADVVLTLDDVRTVETGEVTEGHGSKTDIGFGAGGGWGNWSGFGGAAVSSYQNTAIGQVVTLAYIDAYTKLVDELGGLPGANGSSAAAAAPSQAVSMTKPGHMYASASAKSKVIVSLAPGTMLYPTGEKDGVWWEVSDELGRKGWVSSYLFELAK